MIGVRERHFDTKEELEAYKLGVTDAMAASSFLIPTRGGNKSQTALANVTTIISWLASMDLEIIDVDKSCFYYTSQN